MTGEGPEFILFYFQINVRHDDGRGCHGPGEVSGMGC